MTFTFFKILIKLCHIVTNFIIIDITKNTDVLHSMRKNYLTVFIEIMALIC
jgi:hypothetical protein